MRVLENIQPADVFKYFEEISNIPRGSGDTKKISDYVANFAKERNLKYIQDEYNNVVIYKNASNGHGDRETVILQGHMDMVCEKEPGYDIDFINDGLTLELNDGVISAKGTTLGGDDGIAVAYMLAILDSDEYEHPDLECVFTADEEIGMLGAAAMDMSVLKGKTMINLDSEDEGYMLVSCAGGMTSTVHIPYQKEENTQGEYELVVSGLLGGHSGVEIDKGRANSNMILGRVLYEMSKIAESMRIVSIQGGLKDNAIPNRSKATIKLDKKDADKCKDTVKSLNVILKNEYKITDQNIDVSIKDDISCGTFAMDKLSTKRMITALVNIPNGIQKMSFDIENLVETSLNLGILKMEPEKNEITMSFSVRSSMESEKHEMANKLQCLAETLGGYLENAGEYPAWEYKEESPLRELMVKTFKEQYGYEPVVQAIHAGVECGLFAGQIQGFDAVSIGPDMKDVHTPKECMMVDSVDRTWKYLLKVLEKI